jgi:hypothetical protein
VCCISRNSSAISGNCSARSVAGALFVRPPTSLWRDCRALLATQHEVDAGENESEVVVGHAAYAVREKRAIDAHDLGDVGDRVFGSPVRAAASTTFPGAVASRRLLVSGTTTVVAMRLALNLSPWTITTGRRNPGLEPPGSSSDAQHTSPWPITIRCARASGAQPLYRTPRDRPPSPRRSRPARASRLRARDARHSRQGPRDRPRSGSCRAGSPARQPGEFVRDRYRRLHTRSMTRATRPMR